MMVNRIKDIQLVANDVQKAYIAFCGGKLGVANQDWWHSLLTKRLNGQPIRAYFTRQMADLLTSSKYASVRYTTHQHLFNAQLPFIFETVITIQYLHNQILDGKSEITDRQQISQNLLAANLLKDQLYTYIDQQTPAWASASITKSVRRCFEMVDTGQMFEQQYNTYQAYVSHQVLPTHMLPEGVIAQSELEGVSAFIEKIKRELPQVLHPFLEVYFQRIYLTCAALFVEITRLLGQLLAVRRSVVQQAVKFSACYGIMRQLVNDNADWLPQRHSLSNTTKTAKDACADLRNGTLTLPLFYWLAEQRQGATTRLMQGKLQWQLGMDDIVFEELIQSHALFKSIQNARILAQFCRNYLPANEQAAMGLLQTCEIAQWNKYLVPCFRHPAYRATYKGSTYYKVNKQLEADLAGLCSTANKQPLFSAIRLPFLKRENIWPRPQLSMQMLLKRPVNLA